MWTLLRQASDWTRYQEDTARDTNTVGVPSVWGNGPQEYPCLVATIKVKASGEMPSMKSAFVFRSDAEALLRVCTATERAPVTQRVSEGQSAFNQWMTASWLALVKELREIKALNPDNYERSLAEAIQLVDEVMTERGDARKAQMVKMDRDMVDRLPPSG